MTKITTAEMHFPLKVTGNTMTNHISNEEFRENLKISDI
jgi:hypothetical protein